MKQFLSFFALLVTTIAINCLLSSEVHAQISVSVSDSISTCTSTVFFTSSVSDTTTTTVTTIGTCGSATSTTGVFCGTTTETYVCGTYICGWYFYPYWAMYCTEYCTETIDQYATETTFVVPCGISTYAWDFGDGTGTSSLANPTYTYASAGTYTVTFIITDSCDHSTSSSLVVTIEPGSVLLASNFCVGDTATATITGIGGGSWSSSNPGVATISGSGLLTAIAVGVDSITYSVTDSCGTLTSTKVITVGIPPTVSSISGFTTVCITTSTTLTDAVSGGIWSVSNSNATVAGGVVHGVSAGLDTITYNLATFCGSASATKVVSINSCSSEIISVLSDSIPSCSNTVYFTSTVIDIGTHTDSTLGTCGSGTSIGGVFCGTALEYVYCGYYVCGYYYGGGSIYCIEYCWEYVNQYATVTTTTFPCAIASYNWNFGDGVGTSSLANPSYTYAASGTYTVALTVTDSCSHSSTSTVVVTIEPGSILLSPAVVCAGATDTATVTGTTGGSWNSSNPGIVTISTSGVITGVSAGVDTITYSVTTSCGTSTTTRIITVSLPPTAGTITGLYSVCAGSNTSLSDSTIGGAWASSNIWVATVNTTGIVTGVGAGIATISYTVSGSCGAAVATRSVTVDGGTSIISTIAGTGTSSFSGDGGDATSATLSYPAGIITDTFGNIYFADQSNYRVRKISASGIISTIAGIGTTGYSGDGSAATSAEFSTNIWGVAVDNYGNVYIADRDNERVRKVSPSGIVATIAGTGVGGYSGDGGAATAAQLNGPCGVTLDNLGNLYICDQANERIRKINTSGIISTIAGNGSTGYSGDGGMATDATLLYPANLLVNSTGEVFISDQGNNVVRKVAASGIITTIAGTGTGSYSGDGGLATSATLHGPSSLCLDNSNNLYIADGSNNVIRKINTSGIISTFAGTGTSGYSGDGGAPAAAQLNEAWGVAIDVSGNIYISDYHNNRIRKVTPGTTTVAPITGTSTVCAGLTITLSDTTTGGVWSSIATGIATIDSAGLLTGVTSGVDTIRYSVFNACGTVVSTFIITVNGAPAVAAISGTNNVCVAASITLSDATSGGTWSVLNSHASVSGGMITGSSAGIDTVEFAVSGTCGSTTVTKTISVNPLPDSGLISGTDSVCPSSTTSLSETVSGGVWSSGGTGIATINPAGVVTGIATGTSLISYTVTNTCGSAIATTPITVNLLPDAGSITGTLTVCAVSVTSLTDIAGGGTWGSSSTGVATINSSGDVSAIAAGTTTIDYSVTNGCGTAIASSVVTVNPLPVAGIITGTTTVCAGSNTTLSDSIASGTWSSASTGIATIISGGVTSGISAGTSLISYTVTNSCGAAITTTSVTVNPLPVAGTITGTAYVCPGSGITLSDTSLGGTWSSSATGIASVSSTGIVTGVSAGTTGVTYTVTNSCGTVYATKIVTVNPLPDAGSIIGTLSVCVGSGTSLSDLVAGGTWSSSTPAHASVSTTGLVSGLSAGTTTISYLFTNICGSASTSVVVTVNPLPVAGSISGANLVCQSTAITLSESISGGTWTSSNPMNASVDSLGIVTGNTAGTTIITYTVSSVCGSATATKSVTIHALTNAGTITGSNSICFSGVITLSDLVSGGSWSSSFPAVANVDGSGHVNGYSAGTADIHYTVSDICGTATATLPVTVYNWPAPIAGVSSLCIGSTLTLTDAATGATVNWSSSNPSVASAGSSLAGIITGMAAGTATVSYSNGCGIATTIITVNPFPSSITGIAAICTGNITTLSDSVSGGTWSTDSAAIATIGITNGIVDGLSAGITSVHYSNGCGSPVTKSITINPLPSMISGLTYVCSGEHITLGDLVSGGAWSSSSSSTAAISSTGVITGSLTGVVNITYTLPTMCFLSMPISVNPLPDAGIISGSNSVCIGAHIILTDTFSMGTIAWSSLNTAVATVTGGIVAGLSADTVTITYSVTNSCGTATASKTILVKPLADPGIIVGAGSLCQGSTITLTDTVTGGTWSRSNIRASVSGGIITGITAGVDTIIYSSTNSCGTANTYFTVTINPSPRVGIIAGADSICVSSVSTYSDATIIGSGTWSCNNTCASIIAATGVLTAVIAGTDTIKLNDSNSCGSIDTSKIIHIIPQPNAGTITGADSLCAGTSILLAESVPGGSWVAGNTNAMVSATGLVAAVSPGTDSITYSVSNFCGAASSVKEITIKPLAEAGTLIGSDSVCVGTSVTITPSLAGGEWSRSNTNTSLSGGIVMGAIAGVDTIIYTAMNTCDTSVATKIVHIIPQPDAGTISGKDSVCVGANDTLSPSFSGGIWGSSDTNALVLSGIVTGNFAGPDTILYAITNYCGTATTFHPVFVKPLPDAGIIAGTSWVCMAMVTTLTDVSAGGIWSVSNNNSTISESVVRGVTAGTDTVSYSVSNTCGNAVTTKIITIMPLPDAGAITGSADLCVGTTITLTDTAPGGTWVSADTTIATISGSIVTGLAGGTVTIAYYVSNICGIATTGHNVNVYVLPPVPYLAGQTYLCIGGMNDTLIFSPGGGTWSQTNTNDSVINGVIIGLTPGLDTVIYTSTNVCGTKSNFIQINIFSEGECDSLNYINTVNGDNEGFKVYPNPAAEMFTVEFTSVGTHVSIALNDMFGQLIQSKDVVDAVSNKIQFNTIGLASGTYMIKAIIDNRIYRKKIVIMNK